MLAYPPITRLAKPHLGQRMTVHGVLCQIIAIHRAGTVDVASLDGKRFYRVSGLSS